MSTVTHTFPNGFRVIYEKPLNEIPISSAYVFCDIGSIHEHETMRGVSHFIEHMCFKGTEKIPNSKDIFIQYSKIGAYFNAFTEKRYTCYTIKCQDEFLKHSLNIVSDMLMNSLFNRGDFEKEHKVVIEENNNRANEPTLIMSRELDTMLYTGSSYQYPIDTLDYHIGMTLQYEDVVNFYHTFYHPSNMVLSIVSHIPFSNIKKMISTSFFSKTKRLFKPHFFPTVHHGLISQQGIQYRLLQKDGVTNVNIMIGFRTCGRDSPDRYTLKLLSTIFGSGFTGRLMSILRERLGLVYGAYSDTTFYEYTGDFTITTKTEASKLFSRGKQKGVLPTIIKILNDIIENGVTESEIKNAKGNIKGTTIMSLEDISIQTRYNGHELILDHEVSHLVPYSKIFETHIEKITRKQINDAIKRYFVRNNMNVCILGEQLVNFRIVQSECEKLLL